MIALVPAGTDITIVVTSVHPLKVPTATSLYCVFTWVTREPVAPPLFGPAIAALIPIATSAPIVTSTTARRYRIAPPSGLGRSRTYPGDARGPGISVRGAADGAAGNRRPRPPGSSAGG